MDRKWKNDCIYRCPIRVVAEYECILDHDECQRPPQPGNRQFYDSGVCRYYRESHPVNDDGTVLPTEEG